MVGEEVLHYKILEKIGAGGMGVVYKAQDTKLDRIVALKFLPEDLADDETALKRLLKEAKSASKINHPNVCTIYTIEEYEDTHFIVMEYVEGQTLRAIIKASALQPDEAIEYAIQIVQALKSAHDKSIIHRDIKSENIMINTDNIVKVMDFGLAKIKGEAKLTMASGTVGTTAYMSPEQLQGMEIDHMADIWSFGVVLYEMVTGKFPFKGEYEAAIMYSIVNTDPEPLNNVAKEIELIVYKALARNQDERYQKAGDILESLNDIKKTLDVQISEEEAEKQKPKPSIAVLPFANMSADPEQEYFCDGMAEDIINALSQIEDLHVVARTSAFSFKGKDVKIQQIGQELNAELILEGSVRKVGNRLRITAQLIKVADGYHLWSEQYDRELDDVFVIQDEISLAIVDMLKLKLTPRQEARLVSKQTANSTAHEEYLKGRYFWNQRGPGLKKAVEHFELALAEDGNYASAYAGLADTYALLGFYSYLPPREVMPKAKEAALRALQIDDNLAEAHCSLGFVHTVFDWDWESARKEFQQAFELNPRYGPAHYWYTNLLMVEGRLEEAITQVRHGLKYDPLSVYMQTHLGIVYLAAKKYREASEQLHKALELNPNFMTAQSTLGVAYYFQGRVEEGIREIQKAIDSSDRDQWPVATMGAVCAATGDRKRAKEILMELERRTKKEYISAMRIAHIYTHLDEKNKAFDWLEKAYEERSPLLFTLAQYAFLPFDNLRTDARFEDLLHRIGVRDDE